MCPLPDLSGAVEMDGITPSKLAFVLTVVTAVSFFLITALCVPLVILLDTDPDFLPVFVVLPWYVFTYFAIAKVLRFREEKWKISLVKSGQHQFFKGGSFLKFYLGFVWRAVVLAAVINPLTEAIAANSDESLLLGFVSASLTIYLAYLWLLKFPFGEVSIGFNVLFKHVPYIRDSGLPTPTEVVFEQRGTESVLSSVGNILQGLGGAFFFGAYFVVGVVQFFAIYDFVNDVWGWWGFFSFIGAGFLAYIPILGGIAGIYAAYSVWEWDLIWSVLLFGWPLVLFVIVLSFVIVTEGLRKMKVLS